MILDAADQASIPLVEHYDLLEYLREFGWLKIPFECIKECGPAAQTFGGFLKISNRESFRKIETIANHSGLPRRTTQRHLDTLDRNGWLVNFRRERMSGGRLRRTATRKVMHRTIVDNGDYIPLPRFVKFQFPVIGNLSWSGKVLLGMMCRELLIASKDDRLDRAESLDELDVHDDRFRFSLTKIQKLFGMDHKSVTAAKRELDRAGIAHLSKESDGENIDLLLPSSDFTISRWKSDTPGYVCWELNKRRPNE